MTAYKETRGKRPRMKASAQPHVLVDPPVSRPPREIRPLPLRRLGDILDTTLKGKFPIT
jgi:hypothetical protein